MYVSPEITEALTKERMHVLDALARDALRRSIQPREPWLSRRLAVLVAAGARRPHRLRPVPTRVPTGC